MPLAVDPSPADLGVTSLHDVRESDHSDQTQQQGNAKKRKVLAHLSGSQMGPMLPTCIRGRRTSAAGRKAATQLCVHCPPPQQALPPLRKSRFKVGRKGTAVRGRYRYSSIEDDNGPLCWVYFCSGTHSRWTRRCWLTMHTLTRNAPAVWGVGIPSQINRD